MNDIECILACPNHGPQFRVERIPAGQEGAFMNRIVSLADNKYQDSAKLCPVCDSALIREDPEDART